MFQSDISANLTSPDFKRITGKLRVVKRRKRSDVFSESKLPTPDTETAVKDKSKATKQSELTMKGPCR